MLDKLLPKPEIARTAYDLRVKATLRLERRVNAPLNLLNPAKYPIEAETP
jgi:hypothetical protein